MGENSELTNDFGQGRRILLIEDNEINAQITKLQLEEQSYEVIVTNDGQEGLDAYLQSQEHYFSAVVTDIMMPVMDGTEATMAIRRSERSDSNLPILAITANAFPQDLLEYESCGINKCLTKPYKKNEVFDFLYQFITEYEKSDVKDF